MLTKQNYLSLIIETLCAEYSRTRLCNNNNNLFLIKLSKKNAVAALCFAYAININHKEAVWRSQSLAHRQQFHYNRIIINEFLCGAIHHMTERTKYL